MNKSDKKSYLKIGSNEINKYNKLIDDNIKSNGNLIVFLAVVKAKFNLATDELLSDEQKDVYESVDDLSSQIYEAMKKS